MQISQSKLPRKRAWHLPVFLLIRSISVTLAPVPIAGKGTGRPHRISCSPPRRRPLPEVSWTGPAATSEPVFPPKTSVGGFASRQGADEYPGTPLPAAAPFEIPSRAARRGPCREPTEAAQPRAYC
eukprot:scaffold518_cov388-Prasinococcus_capsulatus_cf.AAC.76